MKTGKTFWGLLFLAAAMLLILDALELLAPIENAIGGVSVLSLILGIFLLAFIISRIAKGKFGGIFVPLSLMFMLFEENIAMLCGLGYSDIMNNWLALLCGLLLDAGFNLLLPKEKRSPVFTLRINNRKREENSLGSSTVYIDCEDFTSKSIENNLGSCAVYFVSPESYVGGGAIYVENNLGHITVNVPSNWRVKSEIENNLGRVSGLRNGEGDGPVIYMRGENNLGNLTIEYV